MDKPSREFCAYLSRKYEGDCFWYTEYPHKSFWSTNFGDYQYRQALRSLFSYKKDPPILLYLHIPFCQQMCYFCICHFHITHNYERVKNYLVLLYGEMNLLKEFLKSEGVIPNFQEVYLGGGSPTYLQETEFDQLLGYLETLAPVANLREFAIEIDPRRVNKERMRFYHSRGINRVSFGIQDFDPAVQEAVNRIQPASLIENLLSPEIRTLFRNGINFDIICGLPRQTADSFSRTIEKVIFFNPDRVSLTYITYSPETARHQRIMTQRGPLPDLCQKKEFYLIALDLLTRHGYIRSGYDHFAKKTDAVGQAREQKKMIWNSFGFTPGICSDIIGLGEHSYGTLGPHYYSQNFYETEKYAAALNRGEFPAFRGHHLNQDDIIRRNIIHQLRGYFEITVADLEREYQIDFAQYFEREIGDLKELVKDGLVEYDGRKIMVTEPGKQFANLICSRFDSYLRKVTPR